MIGKVRKWFSNYWYYYKWTVLIILFFAAVIVCVGTAPDPVTGRVPDYLGIGADQTVFTPSLQLFPL